MAVLTSIVIAVATALLVWSTSSALGAEAPTAGDVLLSHSRQVVASSSAGCCPVQAAVDGRPASRWVSDPVDRSWISVDLGAVAAVHRITLIWDDACAAAYELQTSSDRDTWHTVYATTTGTGGTESVAVDGTGRFVRMNGLRPCRPDQGYALREFEVYGTTDTRAPTAPGALRLVGSAQPTSVTLGWSAATDNVGVSAYDVVADGRPLATVAGDATHATLTGLAPATSYRLWITARDGAGNVSARSGMVTVTTPGGADPSPPSPPGGLAVAGSTSGSVTLAWTPSTDNAGVVRYCVLNAGLDVACVPATSARVDGLDAGTVYRFTVVAVDAAGNRSAPSVVVSAATKASPPLAGGTTAAAR
jgi:chitodextrinase